MHQLTSRWQYLHRHKNCIKCLLSSSCLRTAYIQAMYTSIHETFVGEPNHSCKFKHNSSASLQVHDSISYNPNDSLFEQKYLMIYTKARCDMIKRTVTIHPACWLQNWESQAVMSVMLKSHLHSALITGSETSVRVTPATCREWVTKDHGKYDWQTRFPQQLLRKQWP